MAKSGSDFLTSSLFMRLLSAVLTWAPPEEERSTSCSFLARLWRVETSQPTPLQRVWIFRKAAEQVSNSRHSSACINGLWFADLLDWLLLGHGMLASPAIRIGWLANGKLATISGSIIFANVIISLIVRALL